MAQPGPLRTGEDLADGEAEPGAARGIARLSDVHGPPPARAGDKPDPTDSSIRTKTRHCRTDRAGSPPDSCRGRAPGTERIARAIADAATNSTRCERRSLAMTVFGSAGPRPGTPASTPCAPASRASDPDRRAAFRGSVAVAHATPASGVRRGGRVRSGVRPVESDEVGRVFVAASTCGLVAVDESGKLLVREELGRSASTRTAPESVSGLSSAR